jgi:DNA topoisomerase-1
MAVARSFAAGRITYMRTDSINLSNLLSPNHGGDNFRFKDKYSKHVSSRQSRRSPGSSRSNPTCISDNPDTGSQNEKKLYELIWKRTIASQMADAEIERTSITIDMSNSPVTFQANGEVVKFDGFLRVYAESSDQENGDEERYVIPPVKKGMPLESEN